jgi:hypothetical protein
MCIVPLSLVKSDRNVALNPTPNLALKLKEE